MLYLVGNPEDMISHDKAHIIEDLDIQPSNNCVETYSLKLNGSTNVVMPSKAHILQTYSQT